MDDNKKAQRRSVYFTNNESDLVEDLDLLADNEPLMSGLDRDRRGNAYYKMILRRHRDSNLPKLKKLKKIKPQA